MNQIPKIKYFYLGLGILQKQNDQVVFGLEMVRVQWIIKLIDQVA